MIGLVLVNPRNDCKLTAGTKGIRPLHVGSETETGIKSSVFLIVGIRKERDGEGLCQERFAGVSVTQKGGGELRENKLVSYFCYFFFFIYCLCEIILANQIFDETKGVFLSIEGGMAIEG